MKALLLVSMMILVSAAAWADDDLDAPAEKAKPGSEPKIIYRQKTTINFDDRVVEGSTTNPEGVYVVTPPDKQFGSLLKLRPNFHRELMRDALLLK